MSRVVREDPLRNSRTVRRRRYLTTRRWNETNANDENDDTRIAPTIMMNDNITSLAYDNISFQMHSKELPCSELSARVHGTTRGFHTLVHFSAWQEHYFWDTLSVLRGLSGKDDSG